MTIFLVGGLIVVLIIGLLVYFFIMRSKTIKINRKTVKKGPEHQMLSLVTIDHNGSPDKIMPYPIPDKSISDEQHSANLAGSIMNLVKVDCEELKSNNFSGKEARKHN